MSNYVENIITKRLFDFSKVQSAQTQDIPLCRAIDVTDAKAIDLVIRVHSRTISAGSIDVITQAVSLTSDEPDTDFISGTALATVTLNTAAPVLHLASLSSPFGHMIRIILRATGAASATIQAVLSIDIVKRDS